ncbi:MAG: hypothetical protein ACYTDT_14180, partial [Planctomycetota bacterium]
AEPWFDLTDEQQSKAEQWDRWWKRQHERAGQLHRPCISLAGIKEALPDGDYKIEVEYFRQDVCVQVETIEKISAEYLEKIPEGDPDAAEYGGQIEYFREHGFSYNGTMIVTVRLA